MSIAMLQSWLLWCTVLNFGVLALWGALILLPHGWLYGIWRRWFALTDPQFDVVMIVGLSAYKILVLVFNLIPYVALRIAAG